MRRLALAVSTRRFAEYSEHSGGTVPISKTSAAIGAAYIEEMLLDPGTSHQNINGLLRLDLRREASANRDPGMDSSTFEKYVSIMDRAIINAQQDNIPFYYQSIIDECHTAFKLARAEGVDPALMFEDEERYARLIRTRYTPATFAERDLGDLNRFLKRAPGEVKGAYLEAQELREEMSSPQELEESVRLTIAECEMQGKRIIREKIHKFWGQEGLDSLPAGLKEALEYAPPKRKMLIMEGGNLDEIIQHLGDEALNVEIIADPEGIEKALKEWHLDKSGTISPPIIIFPQDYMDNQASKN